MLLEVQGDVVENKIKVFASITNDRVTEITGRIICSESSGSGYSKICLEFEGNFRQEGHSTMSLCKPFGLSSGQAFIAL